jgi:hypothetical protein
MLCDFAQVREGVLFVASGGVSRFYCPPERPAPMPLFLALMIECGPDEALLAHEVNVRVSHSGTAQELGRATVAFQAQPTNLNPGEGINVPVALPLGSVGVTEDGAHDIHVSVDSGAPTILTAYAMSTIPQPPPPPQFPSE